MHDSENFVGQLKSPGGFVFGIQGWTWGEQRPTTITFFLDGSAMVCDQHGRPIKGTVTDGKEVWFAMSPPEGVMVTSGVAPPYPKRYREVMEGGALVKKSPLATHAEVIASLARERIDWATLISAGVPQLSYEELKKLNLPMASIEELRRIPDPELRKVTLRVRREQLAESEKDLVVEE